MAEMIPLLGPSVLFESAAEEALYREMQSSLPDDWVVLYSIWIRKVKGKGHAEIDLLVISDTACLVIEVKGGICWKDADNMWHFRPSEGGKEDVRREGPFDQARKAYYAVQKHFKKIKKSSLFYNYNWGYAVIIPDCAIDVSQDDIGTDPALLRDVRQQHIPLAEFIESVSSYWLEDNQRRKREIGRDPDEVATEIDVTRRKMLSDVFRKEVRPIQSAAVDIHRSLAASNALTEQQAAVLDVARDIDRILLKGGAGTGKTLLALEQAKRRARDGDKVLFTCFNRVLAESLRRQIQSEEFSFAENITVAHFHALIAGMVSRSKMADDIPDDWDGFDQVVVDLVTIAIDRTSDFEPFDYIVVDEGQDLMTANFLDTLGLLQNEDLSKSSWFFCYDPQQTIYLANFEPDAVEVIEGYGTPLILTKNCRNTRSIAAHVSCLSHTEPAEVLGPEGPDVNILYYEDMDELLKILRTTVNKSITDLIKAGFKASDLVILVPKKQLMEEIQSNTGFFTRPLQKYSVDADPQKICWSTLHSFKGLEAPEVLLTGFDTIGEDLAQAQLYVGGSRARGLLHVLLRESDYVHVEQVLPRIIGLLSVGVPRSPT